MRNLVVVTACALAGCGILMGQFQFGSVNGLIIDPSHSPVPEALVEIRSKTTNVAQRVTTSASGEYSFVSLPPDQYAVTVSRAGFRLATRSFQLLVDQRLQADITLEIGNVTDQVTVSAEAPLLETASSEVGNVKTRSRWWTCR
jgi:protocatechuate 3,4-dioxygenase beta subunit